jgi:protease PrsW
MSRQELDACRICGDPVHNAATGRALHACRAHHEQAAKENRAAALPVWIFIGAEVIFVAIVAAIIGVTNPAFSGFGLVVAGIALALVSAALWLVAFYRMDRLEPEPKQLVFGVFILGAILAAAVAEPLARNFFRVQDWLYDTQWTALLGSILVVGFMQEFLKYCAIRYTVFDLAEFDERIDGIIYGAAVGLGFATMLNIIYVVGNNGVDLGRGAIQVGVTSLAHASFSAVVGYCLARAKFERMGPLWIPAGLTLAALLNGVVSYLLHQLPNLNGLDYNPWYGLVAATIVAAVTFAALLYIVRRQNAAVLGALRASA